jgi:hypothetical protein
MNAASGKAPDSGQGAMLTSETLDLLLQTQYILWHFGNEDRSNVQ